jgi:hypothetical protein
MDRADVVPVRAPRLRELTRRRGQPPNESRRSRMPVRLGGRPLTGELQLRLAVLEDCLRGLMAARDRRSRALRCDLAWIESRDRNGPFAFEILCETLGIDADRLRRRVRAALGQPDELC